MVGDDTMSATGFRRFGTADLATRGSAILMPRSGTGGVAGEYAADITDDVRTFAITREPVAHRIVFTVAHDIFDNWFELTPDGEEDQEVSKPSTNPFKLS